MTLYTPAQTGPKTTEGKAASSRNSTKLGVYSNSLMPGESEQELQELNSSLRETFEVDDGICEMQIRTISQSFLKTQRLHDAEVKLVQTCMARHENRKEFALQAQMPPLSYNGLPDWYFGEDTRPKDKAIARYKATQEALVLRANFKLEYSQQARTLLPNLWLKSWVQMPSIPLSPWETNSWPSIHSHSLNRTYKHLWMTTNQGISLKCFGEKTMSATRW